MMKRIHSHVSPAVVPVGNDRLENRNDIKLLMCVFFLRLLQRSTGTCWSFGAGPSLCQPSARIKEVAVEEVGRDGTAAS